MKQNLLFILICAFGISNINAQLSVFPVKVSGQYRAATADDSACFGYSGDEINVALGTGEQEELSAAIYIPAFLSGLYAGNTISKIHIGLGRDCTNISFWIRNTLTGDNIVSQIVGDKGFGWIEISLSTPFTIPARDFYIGYTATSDYPLGLSGGVTNDDFWLWSQEEGWVNFPGSSWGSLCLRAQIDMQGESVFALKPESLQKSVSSSKNQNFTIKNVVTNYSSVKITSVKAIYQIDNQTPIEQTIQTSIAPMTVGHINIPIKGIASTGTYKLSLKIAEINGKTNYFANTVLNSEVTIVSQVFPRKIVMEEGTGTWCGWCVRGFVGMEMFKQKYPDEFIGIAVHEGDPMEVQNYVNYMVPKFIDAFPKAVIDRKEELNCDPYPPNGSENFFLSEKEQVPIAKINLSGGFTDASKKTITLKTVTTFGFSANNTNYKLAYVLVENGITGYSQENYYAGGSIVMGGFEKKPRTIPDMVYNDVARGIYSEPTGITGSIPASITDMVPIEHKHTINIPTYIKNVNKLEVVVMLLNANTEVIENADIIKISDVNTNLPALTFDEISVSVNEGQLTVRSVAPVESIEIFNISGQKVLSQKTVSNTISVHTLKAGIYIVKVKTMEEEKITKMIR